MKESKTHDVGFPSTGEYCAGVGLGSYAMHGEALHVDSFNLHMGDGGEYAKYYGKANV
jgi:hypothetical protein